MTIQPFAAGSYIHERNTASLLGMKSRLDALTNQLATGRAAESYGGLGAGRATSLSAHASISALDGYMSAIAGATTRVSLANTSLTQLSSLSDTMRTALLSDLRSTSETGIRQSSSLAKDSLAAAVDALNQQSAGVYLFGGRATDAPPVVSADQILNGDPAKGLDGLKQLIAEQRTADLGPGGNGRLTQAQSGATVSLTEDASAEARANFGFSLVSATSSNPAGVTAGLTPATAPTATVAFAQQPQDGDRVRVAVLQPDGSQKILDLTARTTVTPGDTTSFAIGASPAASAANLTAQLGGAPVASVQSANPPGVSATFAGGAPASLSLGVVTPAPGDTITLTLGMHDGTTQTVTLTAKAAGDATGSGEFAIGANPAATAANLSGALATALQGAAGTALAASSASRASQNFFDGSASAGLAPRRVAGNGYAETASAGTVIWYQGDDASADARATASVRVGASRDVAIGAQANEAPIRTMLASIASIAAQDFKDSAGNVDVARYRAAADRAQTLIVSEPGGASLGSIATDFGLAARSMSDAKSEAQAAKTTLLDSLEGIETVSTEEVAAKLISLQTQLQASYQVTGMLSQLSLVNYVG